MFSAGHSRSITKDRCAPLEFRNTIVVSFVRRWRSVHASMPALLATNYADPTPTTEIGVRFEVNHAARQIITM